MKKFTLLILLGIIFTSCYRVLKVIPTKYDYDDAITFTIDKVEEGTSVSVANGHWDARSGYKFVFVFVTVENNFDVTLDLDFNNYHLYNPRTKTKHKTEWVMNVGAVNKWEKVDTHIDEYEIKKRKIVFLYPKEDTVKTIIVNEQMIDIQFEK
jgi:hypothetical protein